jgi:uncharacterized NAD(P)/FAD-binding protein YdhS
MPIERDGRTMSPQRDFDRNPLRIAICGGGASGVLLLNALRRHAQRGIQVSIIEPRGKLGGGVAYSTDSRLHLLNVPAGNMTPSLEAGGFLQWLRAERPRAVLNWSAGDFAPRSLFGEFLQSLAHKAEAAPNLQMSWLRTMADSVAPVRGGWEVVLAHGAPIQADIVVLAMGNETPAPIGEHLTPQERCLVVNDPWDREAKSEIPSNASVMLLGTGLTAVDVAVELLAKRGHTGQIIAVSRRGLLPRPQGASTAVPPHVTRYLQTASIRDILRLVKQYAAQDSSGARLRGIIKELRVLAPSIWARTTPTERQRFLRHLKPYWDVHRHRVAPAIYRRISAALASGQLKIVRGRMEAIECLRGQGSLRVSIRQPQGGRRTLEVARLINCTGPRPDPSQSENPLLQSLIGDGIARADSIGLGLATDGHSRVIGANGVVHENLFALGALSRGSRFETTAIPEIAEQVDALAREILRRAYEVAPAPKQPVASALPIQQSATIVAFAAASPG